MTKRPRERILQKLVYEHYVRPNFDFYQLATAERSLLYSFAEEMSGGEPTADAVALVRRWFDKAWRRAEAEWAQLRTGGTQAFYRSRITTELPTRGDAATSSRASAETPEPRSPTCHCSRASAETPPDESDSEQLELPATHATYAS